MTDIPLAPRPPITEIPVAWTDVSSGNPKTIKAYVKWDTLLNGIRFTKEPGVDYPIEPEDLLDLTYWCHPTGDMVIILKPKILSTVKCPQCLQSWIKGRSSCCVCPC